MKAKSWKIQATEDTIARLAGIADQLGNSTTANGVAAMAVFEISHVSPENLWRALGAIREFQRAPAPAGKALPAPRAGLPVAR